MLYKTKTRAKPNYKTKKGESKMWVLFAKMGATAETLGQKNPKPGIKTVVFSGFKPKKDNAGDGLLYQPQLKIVGDPDDNGLPVFISLSSKADWVIKDFVHGFGLTMEKDDKGEERYIPGDWTGDADKPETLKYTGPLDGRTSKLELAEREYTDKSGNKKKVMAVKHFFCDVPNCDVKHTEDLNK